METANESKEALGLPDEFTFAGRTFHFAPADNLEVVAKYEAHLVREARKQLRRDRKELDPGEYLEEAQRVSRDVNSGVYRYGSPVYFQSVLAHENRKHVALFRAQVSDPSVTYADIDAVFADSAAQAELLGVLWPSADDSEKKG